MHEFWCLTLNDRLILATIAQPNRILDVGCGTGKWARDVADTYNGKVYGVDISPIQDNLVPGNCVFYLGNVLEGLHFEDQEFDLVQSRCIGAGIPDNQW